MKGKSAKPGEGSGRENEKSINTERSTNKKIGCGLPYTYFGNSRAAGSGKSKK